MQNEKQLKQIVAEQLGDLGIVYFLEKQKIKNTLFDKVGPDFDKLQKQLCFLSVRIMTIEFAISAYKDQEKKLKPKRTTV